MVSTAGAIVIVIVVLLVVAIAAWVVFAQLHARKLGLPPSTLSSYLPWRQRDNAFGSARPASSGVAGWFSDQVHKFKNRSNLSAAGAYEQPLHGGAVRGRHGFGALDPDEAWDARVGHEADGYGYYEEQELSGTGRGRSTEYAGGGGYDSNLAATPAADYHAEARGRPPTRSPAGQRNPFDDDAEIGLRGMSPRPIDTTMAQQHKSKGRPDSGGSSLAERRSAFQENV